MAERSGISVFPDDADLIIQLLETSRRNLTGLAVYALRRRMQGPATFVIAAAKEPLASDLY